MNGHIYTNIKHYEAYDLSRCTYTSNCTHMQTHTMNYHHINTVLIQEVLLAVTNCQHAHQPDVTH